MYMMELDISGVRFKTCQDLELTHYIYIDDHYHDFIYINCKILRLPRHYNPIIQELSEILQLCDVAC